MYILEELNDNTINDLFSFVFGWHGFTQKSKRRQLRKFMKEENLTIKDVQNEINK